MAILICAQNCGQRAQFQFDDHWPICHGMPMVRESSPMKMIEIYNYDSKIEFIRADQIETIVFPGERTPNDFGAVVLLNGRRIGLGPSSGQAQRILKAMNDWARTEE